MADGVLIVAHGSRDPRSASVALDVAAGLPEHAPDRVPAACFLELCEPTPDQALSQLGPICTLAVVPFLLSRAYHAGVDVPQVVDRARGYAREVRLAGVLGPDPRLVDTLVTRLAETRAGFDSVILAAAGSSHPEANAIVEQVAADLGTRLGLPTATAYASAARPTVTDAVTARRDRGERVAVATYLLAPGFFTDQIAGSAERAGAVAVTEPLGASEAVVEIVADRARQALASPAVR